MTLHTLLGHDYELCPAIVDGKPCNEFIELTCVDADYTPGSGFHSPDIRAMPGEYCKCTVCELFMCAAHMRDSQTCSSCASTLDPSHT